MTAEVKQLDELVRKALEVDPNGWNAGNAKGKLAFIQGRDDEAVVELERAIAFDPGNIDAYSLLGDIYYLTGQEEKAIAVLDKGMRLSPRDPALPRLLLFKAVALGVLGHDAEASVLLNRPDSVAERSSDYAGSSGHARQSWRDAEARELYQRYAALTGGQLATVAQYRAYLMTLAGANIPIMVACASTSRRPTQGRDAGGAKLRSREPTDDDSPASDSQRANGGYPPN